MWEQLLRNTADCDCSNIDASLLIPDDTTAVIIVIVCLDITDARMYYTSTQLVSITVVHCAAAVMYSEPERVRQSASRDRQSIRMYP